MLSNDHLKAFLFLAKINLDRNRWYISVNPETHNVNYDGGNISLRALADICVEAGLITEEQLRTKPVDPGDPELMNEYWQWYYTERGREALVLLKI